MAFKRETNNFSSGINKAEIFEVLHNEGQNYLDQLPAEVLINISRWFAFVFDEIMKLFFLILIA